MVVSSSFLYKKIVIYFYFSFKSNSKYTCMSFTLMPQQWQFVVSYPCFPLSKWIVACHQFAKFCDEGRTLMHTWGVHAWTTTFLTFYYSATQIVRPRVIQHFSEKDILEHCDSKIALNTNCLLQAASIIALVTKTVQWWTVLRTFIMYSLINLWFNRGYPKFSQFHRG